MTLAITTNKRHSILVLQGMKIKYTPAKIKNVLNSLNRCQASVNPTNKLLDRKNFSPANGSPSLYLLRQEILGSQNN